MAEFLTTNGVSDRLEKIIKNANERLILISPYFKVHDRVKELVENKVRQQIDIRVVYGKSALPASEKQWLESLALVHTIFRKNLHAKCYLNENEALLTSMNLYEYSQVNNEEMGIVITRVEEQDLYDSIYEESMRLATKRESADDRNAGGTTQTMQNGFCIRCNEKIAVQLNRPYCEPHYASWKQYKNRKFRENYCHTCGERHSTSFARPECRSCYVPTAKT